MQTICDDSQPPAPDLVQARCRFGLLIGSVYRQWRKKVDEIFKDQGLTDATRMPLVVLLTQNQAMLQKDLAHALSLDSSSLVRVLAQLRDAQLVQWDCDPADRRTKRIALTKQGREIASQILQKSLEIEQAILADLSPQELQVTRTALHKIAHSFDRIDTGPANCQ
ncbi:MAG: MarR family transcriptional regulator [Comamonas sp.]|nr:MarR family transcriptional regulator [Candidatus Comamonas equi]